MGVILPLGFAVGSTGVTKRCDMPKACDGFTDWFKVGLYCVKYFNTSANFTDAEVSFSTGIFYYYF